MAISGGVDVWDQETNSEGSLEKSSCLENKLAVNFHQLEPPKTQQFPVPYERRYFPTVDGSEIRRSPPGMYKTRRK